MNVRLKRSLQEYVDRQIEAGRFESAEDLVQDALERQMAHFAKKDALQRDLKAGLASLGSGDVSVATANDIREMARERTRSP